MRSLISLVALALALTACGGSDKETDAPTETVTVTPSETIQLETAPEKPSTSTSDEPVVPEGESDGCRVAATKWTDRMTDHVLDSVTTAPAFAELLELDDLDDPTSEIKALCAETLSQPVLNGNAKMAEANYELSLCGLSGVCDAPAARRIRQLGNQTATLVGQVRQML